MASVTPASAPATGTATVVVASKLPYPFVLEPCEKRTYHEPVLGGGSREVTQWFPTGKRYTLNGTAHGQNEAPSSEIAGGYALTFGVPKTIWDTWIAQYGGEHPHPMVANELIKAHEKRANAVDWAKEHRGAITGLERINPNNLPPEFSTLKTADEQKAKPEPVEA